MIYLLREFVQEPNICASMVKERMIHLYQQLSNCPMLSDDDFLNITNENLIFVKVDTERQICGTITILLERKMMHGGKYVAHIEDVVVDKSCRGQEVGKQLIHYACEYAKEQNCYKVILNCDDRIRVFYEKCGFKTKNIEMSLYFD